MYNAGIGTPYWFEWEIGIIECLKMLQNEDIESVILQSSDFQTLDDVVVYFSDKSMLNIQVKHTDIDEKFTYSFLNSGDKPLLKQLAEEWKRNKDKYVFRGIQLVTNRKWGTGKRDGKCSMEHFVLNIFPRLQENYFFETKKEDEKEAIAWYRNIFQQIMSEEEASTFTKLLCFRKEHGLVDTEAQICNQIKSILGTDNKDAIDFCVNNLLAKLKEWATSRRTSQEITKEDVYAAMCYSEPRLPQYDIYPEKPIFPSRVRFAEIFEQKISVTDKKVIILEGLPGSGKTNFVSYLSQKRKSLVDFRFYTYLPVNKVNGAYSDAEGFYLAQLFWLSILVQLKKKFEEMNMLSKVQFPLIYRYMSVADMRATVLKYLPIYAKYIGRTCFFFVDGIDHAARSNQARDSFLLQLPRPEEVGLNVKFVLVGQPVNDKYPTWLVNNNEIEYMIMPSLEIDDVAQLLNDCKIIKKEIDINSLANTVISVIGNNTLNVLFAIFELEKFESSLSFDEVEKKLKQRFLSKQIDKYYEWITSSVEKTLMFLKIEAILAFSNSKMSSEDISVMCFGTKEDTEYILNCLYPMIINVDGMYYAFHNDVRLFFKSEILSNSNYMSIVESITSQISANEKLWKYKYDISFNLKYYTGRSDLVLELMDVEYLMDAVLYGISYNQILQQVVSVLKMQNLDITTTLIRASSLSLCLAQFANCIRYYEKESFYLEESSNDQKTISEKYILDPYKDNKQIIDDIQKLLNNRFYERGIKLFKEYFAGKDLLILINLISNDKKLVKKLGYIYRCCYANIINIVGDELRAYPDFADGWLDAGSRYSLKEEIVITLSISVFHSNYLYLYVIQLLKQDTLNEETYTFLLSGLVRISGAVSVIVELCIYGILHQYSSETGTTYIKEHLQDIKKDNNYEYDSDKILGAIKAWFCIYGKIENNGFEIFYQEILQNAKISSSSRGYKPAIDQMRLAGHIFGLFYSCNTEVIITDDDILKMMYFVDQHGAGSCHDCNAYKVVSFIRSIVVHYAKTHIKSPVIPRVCEYIIHCLGWQKRRYIEEFNILFCLTNDKEGFIKVADYWCGDNGIVWKLEYDEMEAICDSVISTLEYFGCEEFAKTIHVKEKYKMFGYIGRKDYSINGLLDCYREIAGSKEKLLKSGLRLFQISELANSIGDNRAFNEVNKTIFNDAMQLGYTYLNAFFEIKNTPQDLVYWRMLVIDSLFANIDRINTDDELLALYRLTNAWIKPYIEENRPYGRMDSLKEYNAIIIERISDLNLQEKLKKNGFYEKKIHEQNILSRSCQDSMDILTCLSEEGYNDKVEKLIQMQIDKRDFDVHSILVKAGKLILQKDMRDFVNNCIVRFIIKESKYGYAYSGVHEMFVHYYEYISDGSWDKLLASIIERFAEADADVICSLWGDFSTLSIYYFKQNNPGRLETLFHVLCDVHESFITANRRIKLKAMCLPINKNITTLTDMVNFQLSL